MWQIFGKRLLLMPLMLGLISFVAFSLIHLAPSDPTEVVLRVQDIELTPDIITQTRQELGLDRPFFHRYIDWLGGVIQGDLGRSFITRQPIWAELKQALPTTLFLASTALGFILLIAVPLALLSIRNPNGKLDNSLRGGLFFLTAMPNYWLALLIIWGLAVKLEWFPVSGLASPVGIILPALTLALAYIGIYFRLLRGAMLQQLQQDYVFYAKARGLSTARIVLRHILPNSIHTLLTGLGMSIPKLLAGSVVIENLFALPGLGRLCLQAIFSRDYPMIQAYVLLMACLFLGFNLAVDVLQSRFDPRLKQEAK